MAANLRFSTAMEALVLMATEPPQYRTSQALAAALTTNPVVVRRLLASLSRAGLVVNTKGPGGGTRLTRPAKQISLRDVYRAIGPAELLHRPVKQEGGAEKEVRKAVHAALRKAEKSFEQELDAITLNQVIKRAGLKAAKPHASAHEEEAPGATFPSSTAPLSRS
jgi:Rrf2 family protein